MIHSVYSPDFHVYGNVLAGYDTQGLTDILADKIQSTSPETTYVAREPLLESLPLSCELRNRAYGGMPAQIGSCQGVGISLDALEYHICNEIIIGATDFLLLLAHRKDLTQNILDVESIQVFLVPAGVVVELYSSTLHYAPCGTGKNRRYLVSILLAEHTNEPFIVADTVSGEDNILQAKGKWLIVRENIPEAMDGAFVGLKGDVESFIKVLSSHFE